jgi:hypothetical protein
MPGHRVCTLVCSAGLSLTVDRTRDDWVVVVASASIARHRSLPAAIEGAGGGLISRTEAEGLAASALRRPAG